MNERFKPASGTGDKTEQYPDSLYDLRQRIISGHGTKQMLDNARDRGLITEEEYRDLEEWFLDNEEAIKRENRKSI